MTDQQKLPEPITPAEAAEFAAGLGYPLSHHDLERYAAAGRLPMEAQGESWVTTRRGVRKLVRSIELAEAEAFGIQVEHLRWNLELTPDQRLERFEAAARSVHTLRMAGRELRKRRQKMP